MLKNQILVIRIKSERTRKNMGHTIDILMTTYQTEIIYLKKQIDSILRQTYQKFRLLISDDCSSSQEMIKLLKKYQKEEERIEVFFQETNLGYIKNFEFLLSKSHAEYICFCDHDDIWYPKKIEMSLRKLKEEDVDLVYVNANQIDKNDIVIRESYFQYKSMPLVKKRDKLLISRCVGIGCSQMFTSKVKEQMLPYKACVMAQDWLAAFIASENKGVAYIKEPLFGYRLHETNVFGGRSLSQNLARWKTEHGDRYESYLKYRNEKVIDRAYLEGALMCEEYSKKEKNQSYIENLIKYYLNIRKSKYFNFHWISYIKFLGGKSVLKKMVKEFVIFHLPIVGYIQFKYR